VDPRALRTVVLFGVIAVLATLALYGAHRTLTLANRRQCAADGGRWDKQAQACLGARLPPAPAGR
jgi:hypothetical protein